MAKIYYDKDADISLLEGKTVGIIGYGNQGREWKEEQEKGMPEFKRLVKHAMESDISRLEEDLINNS